MSDQESRISNPPSPEPDVVDSAFRPSSYEDLPPLPPSLLIPDQLYGNAAFCQLAGFLLQPPPSVHGWNTFAPDPLSFAAAQNQWLNFNLGLQNPNPNLMQPPGPMMPDPRPINQQTADLTTLSLPIPAPGFAFEQGFQAPQSLPVGGRCTDYCDGGPSVSRPPFPVIGKRRNDVDGAAVAGGSYHFKCRLCGTSFTWPDALFNHVCMRPSDFMWRDDLPGRAQADYAAGGGAGQNTVAESANVSRFPDLSKRPRLPPPPDGQ